MNFNSEQTAEDDTYLFIHSLNEAVEWWTELDNSIKLIKIGLARGHSFKFQLTKSDVFNEEAANFKTMWRQNQVF